MSFFPFKTDELLVYQESNSSGCDNRSITSVGLFKVLASKFSSDDAESCLLPLLDRRDKNPELELFFMGDDGCPV